MSGCVAGLLRFRRRPAAQPASQQAHPLFSFRYMKFFTSSSSRVFWAVALATAVGAGQQALAQTDNPGPGGPAPGTPTPTAVPLDGGASLLLAGGVAYGLRRLRQRRKQ